VRPLQPLLAALAALGLAAAGPVGWERALPGGGRLPVTAEPVTLSGGTFSGATLAGAWQLWSAHPRFGGLSGIVVEDGRLRTLTDQGWWFGAELAGQGGRLLLEDARIAPMRDPGGETYRKAGGDAEGLARFGDGLAVSFERDHRIMLLRAAGQLGGTLQFRAFERLPSNEGLEALATLPDGRLIAFAESREEAGVPVFQIDPDAGEPAEPDDAAQGEEAAGETGLVEAHLPVPGRHRVTGADVGPDGRLYLVLRHFALTTGVSIRVMRYRLGEDGLPLAGSAETLAAFEQGSGIDNMEGIAVEAAPDGGLRLWLVSDDNFNPIQRTLLLRFDITR